jgi:hypothetical protein
MFCLAKGTTPTPGGAFLIIRHTRQALATACEFAAKIVLPFGFFVRVHWLLAL